MIDKHDIITMAHRIVRHGRGVSDRRIMHPYREWYVGLAIAFLIAIAGVTYNTQTFRYYLAIEENIVANDASAPSYRDRDVQEVIERYREREDTFIAGRARLGAFASPVATSTATTSTTEVVGAEDPAEGEGED